MIIPMKIGFIGLGKMGKNMVIRLLEQGIEVVAWNRSPNPRDEVRKYGAETFENIKDLADRLDNPKTIFLMLPAGDVTDEYLNEVIQYLTPGDLVVDLANSYYKDTLRRSKILSDKGVHFMDIGVSGGPAGARNGACLMIGGSKEDYEKIKEFVVAAAYPNAYKLLGSVGAGHFAKMVHNGIEYGMMEAIAEGAAVLKKSPFNYNLVEVMDLYNHQSVVTSRLVGWAVDAFKNDPQLENISSTIGSGGGGEQRIPGEADWTVEAAKELDIDTPVIEDAISVREKSGNIEENSPNGFRNKVVSALRGQFGQHDVKKP